MLHFLHVLKCFFFNLQRCCELDLCFIKETQRIWDCYLPYIRRYGDSVASTFSAIPTLLFPRVSVSGVSHYQISTYRLKTIVFAVAVYFCDILGYEHNSF